MRTHSKTLHAFAGALLDPGGPEPDGVIALKQPVISERFAVYRNNVFSSLIDALRDSFPVIVRLVGDEFFTAMAREFIIIRPPSSPVLLEYGQDFAEFLENFEPVSELLYLPDVARLEMAWLNAYHAGDARPLNAGGFSGLTPDKISAMSLSLHPSLHVVRSAHPVLAIWVANQDSEADGMACLPDSGGDVLILRSDAEVEMGLLPAGTAEFLAALERGDALQAASEAALAKADDFDLTANLASLISCGAFTGYRIG